jgi:prepilin-type N-terminal cleavage/methylation domain-containing protein
MNRRGFTLRELLVCIAIILMVVWMLLPGAWIVEIPGTLVFGWVHYLWRVVPTLNPDPWTVGTAVACLLGVIVGAHLFLRWFSRAGAAQPDAPQWPLKRTLRLVGLVVLMFVAGIAMIGTVHQTSWLARSPDPLTYERGTRTASGNHLKQIDIATHNHHEEAKVLPRSSFTATGQPLHSWQTALLPYVEEAVLHKQIDLTKPWLHPANAQPMSARLKVYLNPTFGDDRAGNFGLSHYAGNVAVVLGDAKTLESFPLGTSNTILAGEVSSGFRAWGDPLNARDPRVGSTGGARAFGGVNGRPAQFGMLDGSVRTFDAQELAELMSKTPE